MKKYLKWNAKGHMTNLQLVTFDNALKRLNAIGFHQKTFGMRPISTRMNSMFVRAKLFRRSDRDAYCVCQVNGFFFILSLSHSKEFGHENIPFANNIIIKQERNGMP